MGSVTNRLETPVSLSVDNMKRRILLVLYYGLFQFLPSSRRLGHLPGGLRYWCCRNLFAHCGRNVNIERRAFFGSAETISIGSNSGIGVGAKLGAGVVIGENVLMGEDVLFLTQNHAYKNAGQTIGSQGDLRIEGIVIEDDVWIGSRAIILPGVVVGKGAVIGAGSVVTKNVEPYSVVAGNPARFVNLRE
jgi:maltose O-acetyltransferase